MITWVRGDSMVRWSGPAGTVEKSYELPPESVMAWREYDKTMVLVVEARPPRAAGPKDHRVVRRREGRAVERWPGAVVKEANPEWS
ncbi:hypothetical protein [Streptomyces sp. NBC_01443]|uniref:hypothetical protein n=1 Tax=Streptomyces sp. NBC_01443 TaxID=2903868 RepID=UPI002258E20E|nr:hypothetical protein [Streptomyces sp. NBC_01443]MCX4632646.1 hypothetical protein [Streptomyces sp. NBC_01443]